MDLMRRTAAGELAELFGPLAVDTDKRHRMHRMRARAMQQLGSITGDKADVMNAYVDGVNAGLADLKTRPWPYLLLRKRPKPWQPADTPLVGYAMYFDLQGGANERELALWKIQQVVPPALFALLDRDGTRWDAPLIGQPRGHALLPDAATLDLRTLPAPKQARALAGQLPPSRDTGSNNFAVSGALTRDGRAIVADDMHLGLRAPNIWFRARLRYADARAANGRVDVAGFTLPGLPLVVVGSNGHVGWGFTNGYVDTLDWMKITPCSIGTTPGRCARVTRHDETIRVAGSAPVAFEVQETDWGPIAARGLNGDAFALRWTAQLPGSLNLALIDMGKAASLEQAMEVARRVAIPAQNLLIADGAGRIAWRLTGALPKRAGGCSARHLVEDASGGIATTPAAHASQPPPDCTPWHIDTANAPVIVSPASHRLWSANNRMLDGKALEEVGDAGYALGARAQQIRGDLFARTHFTERDLLAIQLDDRAMFLQRWWQLLRDRSSSTSSPALDELAAAATHWEGRASADSVSYRIVRAWRLAVNARLLDGLTAPAQVALGDDFQMPDLPQFEGVAWSLVTQRPRNLLPRHFASWDALFEDAAQQVRVELAKGGPLKERTWGERNTARICHPLSMVLPGFAKRLLCMPFDPLTGDTNMPRVTAPDFGASERMVVSPGHEADGIIHMPGGQSGHPLSPFWGAGHEDWVHGRASAFLPGPAQHTLRLAPPR